MRIRTALYRGSYGPSVPGRLRWEAGPGLPKTGRLVSFAECGGTLFVTVGLVAKNGVKPMRGHVSADDLRRDGGLFHRVDGPVSRWRLTYRWPFAGPQFNEHLMRVLSVFPDTGEKHSEPGFDPRDWQAPTLRDYLHPAP